IAASSILFAYNWPKNSDRYRRVDKFVKALFAKFTELQKPPRSPHWREANLAATLPGWKRFEGAAELVTSYREETLAGMREQFVQFMSLSAGKSSVTEQERSQLFDGFLRWRQGGGRGGRWPIARFADGPGRARAKPTQMQPVVTAVAWRRKLLRLS